MAGWRRGHVTEFPLLFGNDEAFNTEPQPNQTKSREKRYEKALVFSHVNILSPLLQIPRYPFSAVLRSPTFFSPQAAWLVHNFCFFDSYFSNVGCSWNWFLVFIVRFLGWCLNGFANLIFFFFFLKKFLINWFLGHDRLFFLCYIRQFQFRLV